MVHLSRRSSIFRFIALKLGPVRFFGDRNDPSGLDESSFEDVLKGVCVS